MTLGVSEAEVERTRRQMWTWDGLSLALCNAWPPFCVRDVPTADGVVDVELRDREDGTSTLDPWPFATERVDVRCEARRLDTRYKDETAMRSALEQASPSPSLSRSSCRAPAVPRTRFTHLTRAA